MLHIYCPTCGGWLELQDTETVAVCRNCGCIVPIPKKYDVLESSMNFAEEARFRRDYSAAVNAYTDILKQNPNVSAAFWGRALSRYAVEYQPIGDGSYRLICHQAELDDFASDSDVLASIKYADDNELAYYSQEIAKISELQRDVSRYAKVTAPFDVIIITDSRSDSTEYAKKMQTALNAVGQRVFCPALSLGNVRKQEWEPALHHAFATAKIMIVAAQDSHAFTEDVLFHTERFLSKKAATQRAAASQIPVLLVAFGDLSEYEDIPDILFDGADDRLNMADPLFLEKLSEIAVNARDQFGISLGSETAGRGNYEYSNLLRQARLNLESGDYKSALDLYNQILNYNYRESHAYWGLLLVGRKCRNEDELIANGSDIRNDNNYKNAVAFATEREQQTYQNVANRTEEVLKLHQHQKEERIRQEAEYIEAQKRAEQNIAQEKQRQEQTEEKAQIKGKVKLMTLIFIFVALAVAGGIGYLVYSSTTGKTVKKYNEAMNLYNHQDYKAAAQIFADLDDYKDCKDMYLQCQHYLKTEKYYETIKLGENIETREKAIYQMYGLLKWIPEAQNYLDIWHQDAVNAYEEGNYYEAYKMLYAFGTDDQTFIEIWRMILSRNYYSVGAPKYRVAFIDRRDGTLSTVNCESFKCDVSKSWGVAFSNTGYSIAVIRPDRTLFLGGMIDNNSYAKHNVDNWRNIVAVQISDESVVALTEDGTLLSSWDGVLATNVVQFASLPARTEVVAVRKDGSVYGSDDTLQNAVSEWSDIVAVSISTSGQISAVNKDSELLRYENGTYQTVGSGYVGFWSGNPVSIDSSYLMENSGKITVRISFDGEVGGIVYGGIADHEVAARKFVRDYEGRVGCINPDAMKDSK